MLAQKIALELFEPEALIIANKVPPAFCRSSPDSWAGASLQSKLNAKEA